MAESAGQKKLFPFAGVPTFFCRQACYFATPHFRQTRGSRMAPLQATTASKFHCWRILERLNFFGRLPDRQIHNQLAKLVGIARALGMLRGHGHSMALQRREAKRDAAPHFAKLMHYLFARPAAVQFESLRLTDGVEKPLAVSSE
jgi:hypothetical protein